MLRLLIVTAVAAVTLLGESPASYARENPRCRLMPPPCRLPPIPDPPGRGGRGAIDPGAGFAAGMALGVLGGGLAARRSAPVYEEECYYERRRVRGRDGRVRVRNVRVCE